MSKALKVLLVFAVALSVMFLFGCGGTSGQKINSVADEESEVMSEAKERSKEELPSTYIVEEGDTLWEIAKKAEIYGNRYQWPIIYDANRDILDDYSGTLEAGSKLIIPRNISASEIEEAKRRAQQLGIPPSEGRVVARGSKSDSVAGMSEKGGAGQSGETYDDSFGSEPTPIPEPVKKAKKAGSGSGMIIIVLLGVLAAVLILIFLKKKKKKDDEDSDGPLSGGDSNILG